MSNETWLTGRSVDASKKIFVTAKILLFDFELFIGGRRPIVSDIRLTWHNFETLKKIFCGNGDFTI
jgi:hypothetical protein